MAPSTSSSSRRPPISIDQGRRASVSTRRGNITDQSNGDGYIGASSLPSRTYDAARPRVETVSSSRRARASGSTTVRDDYRDHNSSSKNFTYDDDATDHRVLKSTGRMSRADWAPVERTPVDELTRRMDNLSLPDDDEYTTGNGFVALGPDTSHLNPPSSSYQNEDKGKGKAITSIPASFPKRHVAGTPGTGNSERLDSSFKIRNHDYTRFFRTGRVFLTLWTDSWSSATTGGDQTFLSKVSVVDHNERVYSKVRRFVVVKLWDNFCTCLPVTTYNGRGTRKHGITINEHGFIYSHSKPRKVDGMSKDQLRVELSKGAAKISERSLINYAKPYSVETNVKVKDVGQLDDVSKKILKRYFRDTMAGSDSDGEGPVPSRTPRTKAAELVGVGAGMTISPAGNSVRGTSSRLSFTPLYSTTDSGFASNTGRVSQHYSQGNTYFVEDAAPRQDYAGKQDYYDPRNSGVSQLPRYPDSGGYSNHVSGTDVHFQPRMSDPPKTTGPQSSQMRGSAPEYHPDSQISAPMTSYGPVALSSFPASSQGMYSAQYNQQSKFQPPTAPRYEPRISDPRYEYPRTNVRDDYSRGDDRFDTGYNANTGRYDPDPQALPQSIAPHFAPATRQYQTRDPTISGGYDSSRTQPSTPLYQAHPLAEDEEIRLGTYEEIRASKSSHDSNASRSQTGRDRHRRR